MRSTEYSSRCYSINNDNNDNNWPHVSAASSLWSPQSFSPSQTYREGIHRRSAWGPHVNWSAPQDTGQTTHTVTQPSSITNILLQQQSQNQKPKITHLSDDVLILVESVSKDFSYLIFNLLPKLILLIVIFTPPPSRQRDYALTISYIGLIVW